MKKIIYLLFPLFLFGCSKPTEINGMARKDNMVSSSAWSFHISTIWPDSESRQMIDIQKRSALLIKAKDYDKLDNFAAELRSSKECYANGMWKLADFYKGLSLSDSAPTNEWEARIVVLRNWIASNTNSITARVALAYVLVDYAWNARGSDYASTVSNQGWQLFGQRLNQAMQVLYDAKNLTDKCPVYWVVQMRAALGLGVSKSQFKEIFDQAYDYDPNYTAFYAQREIYLMPRWYGQEGELETDLENLADKMDGDDGDMLYARVVWDIHARASSPNVFKENGFSWPRVNRGFRVIEKRFPNSLAAISEHAYLAAYAGDAETTREYLKKTQGKVDLAVWYYKSEYIRIANWAFRK